MPSARLNKIESCAVLGIIYPATEREAKVAFMKASRKNHPDDKGGDTEKQKSINEAYEVLSGKPTSDGNETQAADGGNTDGTDSDGSDGVDNDMESDSDGDHEEEHAQTDAEDDSTSLSGSEATEGTDDGETCAFDVHYYHLEDSGGCYVVEIPVEDHASLCGCDLNSEDSPHSISVPKAGVVEITMEEHEELCGCDLDAEDSIHSLLYHKSGTSHLADHANNSDGDNDNDNDSTYGSGEE